MFFFGKYNALKNKSKFKIDYRVSGEAFLTKQNATTNNYFS